MGIKPGPDFDKFGDYDVAVSGEDPTGPCLCFQDLRLRRDLQQRLLVRHLRPTPIQKYAIPAIKAGRDVLAGSPTGTGKTASYLVPIINDLLNDWREPNVITEIIHGVVDKTAYPQVLILLPSRELAIQTLEMCKELAKNTMIVCLPAYGGTRTKDQIADLTGKGAHILIATTGRLKFLLREDYIDFSELRYLVLDEADKMLRMGFEKDVMWMVKHSTMVPKTKRQTLMFSATYPERKLQELGIRILNNYLFIMVDQLNAPSRGVEENFKLIDNDKAQQLLELLEEDKKKYGKRLILIFVNRIITADELALFLQRHNYDVEYISSDLTQNQRESALRDFKNKVYNILVATDVLSRGHNIKDLDHVINYDLPSNIPEYVNRIGRTGRLGNRGVATSFFQPGKGEDERIGPELVRCLGHTQKEVPEFLLRYARDTGATSAAARNVRRRRR